MKIYPDISHHHPVTDWVYLRENCPFLISKATQGTAFIDSTLEKFIVSCENMGIPYWLYTYLNKGNELKQAKFLVETCKHKVGKHFVGYILDAEVNNHPQDVLEALTWLEKQGTKCMLYIGYRHYILYEDVIKELGNNTALWEARYGKNDGNYNPAYPVHDLTDLHQYTDRGRVPGLTGNIDLNRLTGRKKESWFTTPLKKTYSKPEVTVYYKACNKRHVSIVDALMEVGGTSTYKERSQIAHANGIFDYAGTASQNTKLLDLLKAGKLKKPGTGASYYKACSKNETSIVDGLKTISVNSSFANREKIAKANGLVGYKGTATENGTLLALLKAGKLRRV